MATADAELALFVKEALMRGATRQDIEAALVSADLNGPAASVPVRTTGEMCLDEDQIDISRRRTR